MKFVFVDESEKCWLVEAKDKHNAIAKAVEKGFSQDMADFYYGLSDGQVHVYEVGKEVK